MIYRCDNCSTKALHNTVLLSFSLFFYSFTGVLFYFGFNLCIIYILPFYRFEFFLQPLEYHEQHRHDEYLENHTNQHTTNSRSSQSTVTMSTNSHSQHQRNQTYNHGQ